MPAQAAITIRSRADAQSWPAGTDVVPFEFRDGHWLVTDLGSTNGTYVNRAKVEQSTRLAIGDQVQVGNVVLEVR